MKSLNSHEFQRSTVNGLLPLADAARLIESGAALAVSGPEAALERLPAGTWIGGTTPYFMTDTGGRIVSDDTVFVTDLGTLGAVTIATYGADELERITADAPDHGISIVIIPAETACHKRFALEAPFFPETFLKPAVGWIAGYDLGTQGARAFVHDGTGGAHADRAVVAHVAWADEAMTKLEIVNPFVAGKGDVITFDAAGFTQRECRVNGEPTDFADWLAANGFADDRLPLVGDYGGAPINVSVQKIAADGETVHLYAPVFPGVDYRFAAPLEDYAAALTDGIARVPHDDAFWSCNCILNFLFGGLEGKSIGGLAGPVTFGEIAYQLLNQTLVVARRI